MYLCRGLRDPSAPQACFHFHIFPWLRDRHRYNGPLILPRPAKRPLDPARGLGASGRRFGLRLHSDLARDDRLGLHRARPGRGRRRAHRRCHQ
jgi:hypothetical protein